MTMIQQSVLNPYSLAGWPGSNAVCWHVGMSPYHETPAGQWGTVFSGANLLHLHCTSDTLISAQIKAKNISNKSNFCQDSLVKSVKWDINSLEVLFTARVQTYQLSCFPCVDMKRVTKCHTGQYQLNTDTSQSQTGRRYIFVLHLTMSVYLCPSQIWTSWSNVPTSAPSTCSSTRCWTYSSRAWSTAATPGRPSTKACASAAGRTAATR